MNTFIASISIIAIIAYAAYKAVLLHETPSLKKNRTVTHRQLQQSLYTIRYERKDQILHRYRKNR